MNPRRLLFGLFFLHLFLLFALFYYAFYDSSFPVHDTQRTKYHHSLLGQLEMIQNQERMLRKELETKKCRFEEDFVKEKEKKFISQKKIKKTIGIVTVFAGIMEELFVFGEENRRLYGKVNSYELFVSNQSKTERPGGWIKIPAILEVMETKSLEWIVWFDADLVVMNFNQKIESIIELYPSAYFITAMNGGGINTGVIILKNNNWSREFLKAVWNREDLINHRYWEQQAIQEEMIGIDYKNYVQLHPNMFPDNFVLYSSQFMVHLFGRYIVLL